ncbi:MAG: sulfatase-like hydrolase/transferase [Gemmatimonadetes bacterium]|nr:sulfatase-like hydrolase/transferase [Gemmatimonadota bacterium]
MNPSNLLFILSDQHTRDITGCYGHPVVRTPNIDSLARRGTRFSGAYTNCPICVPARASLATGRYVHQTGNWDNAFAYDGSVSSWGHLLREQGFQVASIGKLHFRAAEDDNGFSQEIDPLHVVDGVGDILSCIRGNPPFRDKRSAILSAGPGDSTYLQYDVSNADRACAWLAEHRDDEKPWVLFLSFVCPHPPYIAPPELFESYPHESLPLPAQWHSNDWPDHPAIRRFRRFFHYDRGFSESELRNVTAAYYGACTHLDRQVGRVLNALTDNNLFDTTRVLYTSDHGESLGARGLFGKFTMYEEAASVPLILAGPDVPQGRAAHTPVSLVDCFPTVLECAGATREGTRLPGGSLWQIARNADENRTVFSEYHAVGSCNAAYMLRDRTWKYIYYVDEPPQLFNLENDPTETTDLSGFPDHQSTLASFERRLRDILDPEATDARAKADQLAKIASFGGDDAVRNRGAFDNSPVPGEKPAFRVH